MGCCNWPHWTKAQVFSPPFGARVYRPLHQKWISPSSADQKINFLMFGVELKVVRAVFLPNLSPGSPRLRLEPEVPYLYSFVARSGLIKVRELGPVSRTKATKTSLAFHAIFKKFYLKNKAGRQETLFIWKIVMCRGQLCKLHGPVVQGVDNAIHRIDDYPVDNIVCFVSTYPLDSDLSGR